MTSAGPSARRAPLPRLLVAVASAAALSLGLLVVVISPRADAGVPLAPAYHGLAQGVDAASWQHPHGAGVDWHAAAASGQSFAFIKATEGTGPANRYYEADVADARAAGMLVGSYHMARPAMDPAQQAHAFADRLQSVGGPQLPPVLDLEKDEGLDPAELADWTQVFLDTLAHRTGRAPILYTYRYFWIDRMANTHRFAEFPLWLAEYGVSEPTLPVIGGWNEWLFWQRSETGEVPGFTDAVDLNVFAGTRDDLHAWLGHVEPAPAPAPAPAPESTQEPAPAPPPPPAPELVSDREIVEAPAGVPPEAPVPVEPFTIPVPRDLPAPDGVRLPETIEIPREVVAQLPPGMR
ncbi:glycoside hydrolase family 25 protein [Dietzia maris]|uniref:glycoside hydrolase family 25 protein n=1 Tax=Dietzia maris TaxID=37915 RepID=UPI00342A6E4D